jgi:hypothetical protein
LHGLKCRFILDQPGASCALTVLIEFDGYFTTALLAITVMDVFFDALRAN